MTTAPGDLRDDFNVTGEERPAVEATFIQDTAALDRKAKLHELTASVLHRHRVLLDRLAEWD